MDADRCLPRIGLPVRAIQGEENEYGSKLLSGLIARKLGGYGKTGRSPDCGSPGLQQRTTPRLLLDCAPPMLCDCTVSAFGCIGKNFSRVSLT